MIFKGYIYPQWSSYFSKPELNVSIDIEDAVIFNHKSRFVETPISFSAAEIFLEKYLVVVSGIDLCEFCIEYAENKNYRTDRWYYQKRNDYFNYDRLSFCSRKFRKM